MGMPVGIARESELQPIGGAVLGVGLALLVANITLAVHGVTRVRLEQRF